MTAVIRLAEARRSAQISLVAEVADEYFTLRQVEEQLQLARQTLAAVQESYDLNKATFDAGASSELDLRTAEGQVQTAKINVLTYERQLAQAENALVPLVGQPLPAGLPAPQPFNSTNLLAEIPAGLPSELVQRRPDILEAEHTLKAANANIGAARATFFPTINLTASIGTSSSQLSKLFSSGLEFFAAGDGAHLHRWPESCRLGCGENQHPHRGGQLPEGHPDRIPGSGGCARGQRQLCGSN